MKKLQQMVGGSYDRTNDPKSADGTSRGFKKNPLSS